MAHPAGCREAATTMSNNDSHQDSSVENENKNEDESENDDSHVSPEVLAESIRNKTDALHAQGSELADQLERMAEDDEDDDEGEGEAGADVDPTAMMTELLETASDLIEVAHAIEDARLQGRSE